MAVLYSRACALSCGRSANSVKSSSRFVLVSSEWINGEADILCPKGVRWRWLSVQPRITVVLAGPIPNHPKGGFDGAVYAVGEHVEVPSGLSETWAVNGWVSTAD